MSFARKINRKRRLDTLKAQGIYCCGRVMSRKMGYDTENEQFYFCEVCGKEQYVEKGGTANEEN